MSHQVERMIFKGEKPWHGLGTEIPEGHNVSVLEALDLSGCNWDVGLLKLCVSGHDENFKDHPESVALANRIVDAHAIYRKTDLRILGRCGPNYKPYQNRDAFEFFQPFLDAGEAEIHTAGSLAEGEKVWVLAKLNRRPIEVGQNDFVEKYLMLSNSHDGLTAIRVGFSPVRIVCANTLAAAHQNGASALLRVKHTSQTKVNLEKIRDIMNLANASFEATGEQYRLLAAKGINQADLKKYVHRVMEIDENDISTRSQHILDGIFASFEKGLGSDVSHIRGTYWNAYNSITEHLTHHAGRSVDSRFKSLWFGPGAKRNFDALKIAVEMATAV